MPILDREPDIFPANLFELVTAEDLDLDKRAQRKWFAAYTLSRQEKELMRKLTVRDIPFYCPLIPKRQKSPSGRIRTSYVPLFTNYVFLYGTNDQRYESLTTNCISQITPVIERETLTRDLRQFFDLIGMEVPLLPESRLEPGARVRIRSGRFRNMEGTVIRRENEVRLLVSVNFIQRGASMLLEDFELEEV